MIGLRSQHRLTLLSPRDPFLWSNPIPSYRPHIIYLRHIRRTLSHPQCSYHKQQILRISWRISSACRFRMHLHSRFHMFPHHLTGEASTESRREASGRAGREGPAARGAHGSRSARGACHGSATGGDAWPMMGFGRFMHLTVLDQQKGHQRWGFHLPWFDIFLINWESLQIRPTTIRR